MVMLQQPNLETQRGQERSHPVTHELCMSLNGQIHSRQPSPASRDYGPPGEATWSPLPVHEWWKVLKNHRGNPREVQLPPPLTNCTGAALVQPNPGLPHTAGRCLSFYNCKMGIVVEPIYIVKAKCVTVKTREYELRNELRAVLAQGNAKFFKYYILI